MGGQNGRQGWKIKELTVRFLRAGASITNNILAYLRQRNAERPDVVRKYACLDCCGHFAYRSRRRGFLENRVLPFVLLRPVRCVNGFKRSYAFVLTTVRDPK